MGQSHKERNPDHTDKHPTGGSRIEVFSSLLPFAESKVCRDIPDSGSEAKNKRIPEIARSHQAALLVSYCVTTTTHVFNLSC